MAEDRASIDGASVLDNTDVRQVEFSAEVGGDWYDFALHYSVLEALGGAQIDGEDNVLALFGQFREQAEKAAARALARGPSPGGLVVVDEERHRLRRRTMGEVVVSPERARRVQAGLMIDDTGTRFVVLTFREPEADPVIVTFTVPLFQRYVGYLNRTAEASAIEENWALDR